MKQLIGHKCKLHIISKNKNLFYTARILDMTSTHIYFIDKFNVKYIYNLNDIKEISSIV